MSTASIAATTGADELERLAKAAAVEATGPGAHWPTASELEPEWADAGAAFLAYCTPDRICQLVALTRELTTKLARAEAVNHARSLGWSYDDEYGAWYDTFNGALQCDDEDLVSHIAESVHV